MTGRVKSGHMKPLVVMDKERSHFYPDAPCTVELGYPAVLSASTRGIAGPKGIPAPVKSHLQAAFKKAMADPEHVKRMDNAGLAIKVMFGDEYDSFFKTVHERAKRLVEEARKARVEGIVLIQAVIRKDGSVDSFRVLRGLGYGLDESAINTIATKWRFRPGAMHGVPVDVQANIEVTFRLY